MTAREAKTKLDAIKSKLEGWAEPVGDFEISHPPDARHLTDAIKGLVEIVESLLAEREAERIQKGGF